MQTGIRVRGKTIEIRFQHRGRIFSESLALAPTPDNILAAGAIRQQKILALRNGLEYGVTTNGDGVPVDLRASYKEMFRQAKRRGRDGYQLTKSDEDFLIRRAMGKCEVTGIAFALSKEGGSRRPYAPSLDRKDSAADYSIDNVRIVCVAVNLAMNEWGEAVLKKMATGYLENIAL